MTAAAQQPPAEPSCPPEARPSVPIDDTPAPAARRITGTVWLALGVVYLVWGSTYLAIRVVVETMPPLLSAATRFLAAGLLLAALIAWRQGPAALRVTARQLVSAAAVGLLLLVGGNGLVVLAERSVPSGLAALLVASVPFWVVLLRRLAGQRTARTTTAGVLIGLAGLAVLTGPGLTGQVKLGGLLLVVVGALLWACGSFLAGRLPMPENPFAASVYEMLAGGLAGLLLAALRGEPQALDLATVSTRSWVALVYLVVAGSVVAFTAYAWLLQSAPLPLVSTYAYVNPVVAVLLGWLVLGEQLSWPILLGGAIVVGGVGLVVRAEKK